MEALGSLRLGFALPRSWAEVGPEHWGIVAGVVVFSATLLAVVLILACDGSFGRMKQQAAAYKEVGVVAFRSPERRPELYDELLEAAAALPLEPSWPEAGAGAAAACLEGDLVRVAPLDGQEALAEATEVWPACSGEAYIAHGAYDALEDIFGYFRDGPFASPEEMATSAFLAADPTERLVKIAAQRDGKVVGTARLTRHRPRDLNLGVQDLWISPGLRRKGYATEALALLLKHFFSLGYRRVDFFVDSDNAQARRWLEAKFFLGCDGLLRKHGIIRRGNQDVAIYGMTNNQWRDYAADRVAKHLLGRVQADTTLRKRWEKKLADQRQKEKDEEFLPKSPAIDTKKQR